MKDRMKNISSLYTALYKLILFLSTFHAFSLSQQEISEKNKTLASLYKAKNEIINKIKKESGIIELNNAITALLEEIRKKNTPFLTTLNELSKKPSSQQATINSLQKKIVSNTESIKNKEGQTLAQLENTLKIIQSNVKNRIKEQTNSLEYHIAALKAELGL